MPSTIAYSLRLLCIALAYSFAVLVAAEPPSPLVGSTREQVVKKLGEPRSQIAVGNRLVMLYAKERVVLRDGVVVEIERVYSEPVRRPAPAPAAQPTAAPAAPAGTEPAAGTVPAAPGAAAPAPGAATGVAPAAATTAAAPAALAPAPAVPAAETQPAAKAEAPPSAEPKLEIKLIRPPSSSGVSAPSSSRVLTKSSPTPPAPIRVAPTAPPLAPAPDSTPVAAAANKPAEVPATAAKQAAVLPAPAPTATSTPSSAATEPASPLVAEARANAPAKSETEAAETEEMAKRDLEKTSAVAAARKAKLIKASRRRLEAVVDDATLVPATSGISARTYVIAFVTVLGGAAYLIWRVRQRNLELAATRVSQTPFGGGAPRSEVAGADFTAEFLGKLEWKRFEELVEAYYSKTGVVATRVKGGPAVAAQVKIAWKGEPRPFAMVRCISHPGDLIEVLPLQELYTLLAAEDIRRGYVVTTGRFSVAARDYAEEKHLTLLPGDIFLEKLNALPGPARTEIMHAASAGDCTTPSCPTCEAKMARSTDVPPVWRCGNHPAVTLPT